MLSALLAHGHDLSRLAPAGSPSPFECRARAAGHEQRIAEDYSWDGLQRGTAPFLVLQHTTRGEGRLDWEGRLHRLTPGCTMLVTMPHAHRYYLRRGGHWEYFWLLLDGREALRLARAIIAAAGPVLTPPPEVIDRMAAACLALLTGPATPGAASAAGYAALAALHDAATGGTPAIPGLPADIARALALVEDDLARPLTVDRLAQAAGLSRAHFVRRFTAATGRSPARHVLAARLDRAERLLLATDMTVQAIARATGFADGNTLAKVLRRARGTAPLALRATRENRP